MITNLRKHKLLIQVFILPEMIHDVAMTITVVPKKLVLVEFFFF
jgi:hypothetical protein